MDLHFLQGPEFKNWLGRQEGDVLAVLAERMSLRGAPVWLRRIQSGEGHPPDPSYTPYLRCLITTAALRAFPGDQQLQKLSFNAGRDAKIYLDSAGAFFPAAVVLDYTVEGALNHDDAAYQAFSTSGYGGAWTMEEVLQDVLTIANGENLAQQPLWRAGDNKATTEWADVVRNWGQQAEVFAFWRRWYEAALVGQQLDPLLLRDAALIPDEVWQAGPGAVAEAIRALTQKLALARSDNAEVLVPNPETGRLHIVATSSLPDGTERRARRAMTGIARLFGEGTANQHRALVPDLDMLAGTAIDPEATPVELFDACASASRRLRARVINGECPGADQDALVQDYGMRLADLAADILSSDPETQEVLNRRNAIKGNDALIEGREAIAAAVRLALPMVEGRLETALKLDLDIVINLQSDPEERQNASPRFGGRMLRIILFAGGVVGATGAAIIKAPEVLEAARKLAADPLVKKAVEWIMRYLGL